jgi:uncharacterized protein
MTTTLIIPGLYSSGPDHWQTWFEEQLPGTVRVIQSDWAKADLPEWSRRVRRDIARNPGRHILVAHSFGVLAAVHAVQEHGDRIEGALLVAPADPDKFKVTADVPSTPLPFPAVVVASSNDPWVSLWKAAELADRWGADFVNLGEAGHINADSGFGAWPDGLGLLDRLRKRLPADSDLRASASDKSNRVRPLAWRNETTGAQDGRTGRRSSWAANRLGVG